MSKWNLFFCSIGVIAWSVIFIGYVFYDTNPYKIVIGTSFFMSIFLFANEIQREVRKGKGHG